MLLDADMYAYRSVELPYYSQRLTPTQATRGRRSPYDRMEVDPVEATSSPVTSGFSPATSGVGVTMQNGVVVDEETAKRLAEAHAGCSRAVRKLREPVDGRNRIDHFDQLCLFAQGQRKPDDLTSEQRGKASECLEYYHDYDRFCFAGVYSSETRQAIWERTAVIVRHPPSNPFAVRIVCSALLMMQGERHDTQTPLELLTATHCIDRVSFMGQGGEFADNPGGEDRDRFYVARTVTSVEPSGFVATSRSRNRLPLPEVGAATFPSGLEPSQPIEGKGVPAERDISFLSAKGWRQNNLPIYIHCGTAQ
jgi:hypothetical protein